MYVYKRTEFSPYCLYTVGYYEPNGKWIAESDHDNTGDAAKRVAFLNGSGSINTEEQDLFAIAFCSWYSYAEDAQIYKAQKLPAGKMLELYKSRPYLRTDSPEEN